MVGGRIYCPYCAAEHVWNCNEARTDPSNSRPSRWCISKLIRPAKPGAAASGHLAPEPALSVSGRRPRRCRRDAARGIAVALAQIPHRMIDVATVSAAPAPPAPQQARPRAVVCRAPMNRAALTPSSSPHEGRTAAREFLEPEVAPHPERRLKKDCGRRTWARACRQSRPLPAAFRTPHPLPQFAGLIGGGTGREAEKGTSDGPRRELQAIRRRLHAEGAKRGSVEDKNILLNVALAWVRLARQSLRRGQARPPPAPRISGKAALNS